MTELGSAVLPDPSTEFGARIARRLQDETVAWLTVVDGNGTPQPAPIWFLWDGESALIYSRGDAKRLAHLRARPRVAVHLDSDKGGDVVVLTGDIVDAPDEPQAYDNPPYLAKYGKRITGGWGTAERFAEIYSVPLRFHPRRVRGF
jgi:PPOX class probable F420-dependent enzyme